MHRTACSQFSPTPLTSLNVFHIYLSFIIVLLLLLFEFSACFVTPSQCHVALEIRVNSFKTLWFWEQTKPRTLFRSVTCIRSRCCYYYLFIVCCFVFVFFVCFFVLFFIHYCSVDSSHPSSHPPPATDGAAGANATDNANASLVNGTSQPPACVIWWISLLTVSNSLSPRWPAQMLCVCDCTLRDPTPHALQERGREGGREAPGMLQLHSHTIPPGRGRVWDYDLFAIKTAVKSGPFQNFLGRFTWSFIINFHYAAWIWRGAPWERDSLCFSSFSLS